MQTQKIKKLFNLRKFLAGTISVLILAAVFGLGQGVNQASAVKCRTTVNPKIVGTDYDGYTRYGYTKTFTVQGPKSSTPSYCKDINIRDITARCRFNRERYISYTATFRVRFNPDAAYLNINDWRSITSKPPFGLIGEAATDVKDGTKYRIEFKIPDNCYDYKFTVID